jgi:uncharacterized protein YjbI with pentapeptide repeats
VTFPVDADFTGRTLINAEFNYAVFNGMARFGDAEFDGLTSFVSARFLGDADFTAQFRWNALFSFSKFKAGALFAGAKFWGKTYFNNAEFGRDGRWVSFSHAEFRKDVVFQSAVFSDDVDFYKAVFGGAAWFDGAVFQRYARFTSATFAGPASFFGGSEVASLQFGSCSWEEATFGSSASFENRLFTAYGDFRVKKFAQAPRFHGCTFHEAMVFPTEAAFEDRSSEGAAQAYRTLRLGMEKLSARHEAGMFYALEQASLRSSLGHMKRHERWLSWLYETCSDYGRNGARPIVVLIGVAVLFALVYAVFPGLHAVLAGEPIPSLDLGSVGRSATFSLQQVVQPFWVWRNPTSTVLFDGDGKSPLSLAWVATLQSLFSIALVSLSVLALRWRFKRE